MSDLFVALTPANLLACLAGTALGTLVGVLPGLGPAGAMALVLPLIVKLGPTAGLIMLAGIYYGAMYGGSTTSILVNVPGEAASVVTAIDGYRLRVDIEMTPFQKRPHLDVLLRDAAQDEIASTSIVEPLSWKIEFTLHIRGELKNPYTLEARLFYPDGPVSQPQTYTFDVKPPQPSENPNSDST